MTRNEELLKHLLTNSGFQLSKSIEGLSEDEANQAIPSHSMTPFQVLGHLTECCHAFMKSANGEEHAWGTFQPASTTFADLTQEWQQTREQAVEIALSRSEDPKVVHHAIDFLAAHDYYHVGQLCTHRLGLNPEWNMYSIYGM